MAIKPVLLGPGEGRSYDMGPLRAVFKADEPETAGGFSVSEWWLDPRRAGPGPHKHDESEEVFYVLEGTASVLMGEEWHSLPKGSVCIIPRGMMHDFRNEGAVRMGLLNVFLPGAFEPMMPMIVDWFRDNPVQPLD